MNYIKQGKEKRNKQLREMHRGIMEIYPSNIKNDLEKQLKRYKKHMEVNNEKRFNSDRVSRK